jgi:hypothetical protein
MFRGYLLSLRPMYPSSTANVPQVTSIPYAIATRTLISISVPVLLSRATAHTGCTAQHACCILRQTCVQAVRSASIHAMRDI